MDKAGFFASPWPVNLLILLPVLCYFYFKKSGLKITSKQLLVACLFGIAFGFVEASVVVYLRGTLGLLPHAAGTLSEMAKNAPLFYQQTQVLSALPSGLFSIEFIREAATMVMLVCVAILTVKGLKERVAMFLWVFAFWDLFYYAGLWLTVRWPYSLTTPDVLFLIPVPWISQVWFPYLISTLTILTILIFSKKTIK